VILAMGQGKVAAAAMDCWLRTGKNPEPHPRLKPPDLTPAWQGPKFPV
jgi:hypothetical protein